MKQFYTSFESQLPLDGMEKKISYYLLPYNTSLLETIRFLELNTATDFYGVCDLPRPAKQPPGTADSPASPQFVSGYRIRCAINVNLTFPFIYSAAIARNRANLIGQGSTVEYEHEIKFENMDELALWLAGRTLYQFILHSQKMHVEPVECHANSFGLDWLGKMHKANQELTPLH